jgi:hypothetical protein
MVAPENVFGDLQSFLGLINKECNKEQIEDVLRVAKARVDQVRAAGIKAELVFEFLPEAIKLGAVSQDEAYALLCDGEESGDQHIFLYQPKAEDRMTALGDAESVAIRLFGPNWKEQGFPRILSHPVGEDWSDFRIGPTGSLGSGWTAKRYVGEYQWESKGFRPVDADTKIEMWKRELTREVQLIRWYPDGLLELRVPTERYRKSLVGALDGLWRAARPAVDESDFIPFDLTPACKELTHNHERYAALCRLGDVRGQDQQTGWAKFGAPSGRDHVMSDRTREGAIRMYNLIKELVITWFLDKNAHGVQGELRSVVGKYGSHNIHIRAKTTDRAIQHATSQLRRLVRQVSPTAEGP